MRSNQGRIQPGCTGCTCTPLVSEYMFIVCSMLEAPWMSRVHSLNTECILSVKLQNPGCTLNFKLQKLECILNVKLQNVGCTPNFKLQKLECILNVKLQNVGCTPNFKLQKLGCTMSFKLHNVGCVLNVKHSTQNVNYKILGAPWYLYFRNQGASWMLNYRM